MLALAAAFTTETSSSELSVRNCLSPSLGLVTIATAPAAIASMVVWTPFSVRVEQMTTGVGRSAMILRRKVMPSMRGISTSRTITSGHCCFMRSMAISGSAAACSTSIPGTAPNRAVRTWRTTAESSTMSSLMGFMNFGGTAVCQDADG